VRGAPLIGATAAYGLVLAVIENSDQSFLKKSSEKHSIAFQNMKSIKVAVNKEFANFNTKIQDQDEIAFFPPVTGG